MASRLTAAEALSVQEACEVGGFGKSTFYLLINEGLLPAKKLGKKTLVLRSDLLKFLTSLPSATESNDGSEMRIRRPLRRTSATRKDQRQI